MSALISGVKNLLSKAGCLVRGFPFSQVQSAKANGSSLPGLAAGAGSEDCPATARTGVAAAGTSRGVERIGGAIRVPPLCELRCACGRCGALLLKLGLQLLDSRPHLLKFLKNLLIFRSLGRR